MKLSDIGEFGLIQKLKEIAEKDNPSPALVMGIGDDTAAWQSEPGLTLASTDCLIEGVHFTLETTGWYDLGWKSLAVNLSDVAAAGGRARYVLVTLGLPRDIEVENVELLYNGLVELGKAHGVTVAGGDLSTAPCVFINISIIGMSGGEILTRSSARPGDMIALSGCLGAAAAGWKLLQQDPARERNSALVQAFLKPQPRLSTGELLLAKGVKAAIDISDGLAADLGHICEQSGVGAVVNINRLPLHPQAVELFGKQQAIEMALTGGEDYELLFCAPETMVRQVKNASAIPISIIGEITGNAGEGLKLVKEDSSTLALNRTGWQHFA